MAFRGAASQANSSTSTSVVVTVSSIGGTGPQLNDIVLFYMDGGGGGGTSTLTPPSGFSAVPGITQTLNFNTQNMVWYKVATASEPSTYTATSNVNDFHAAQVRVYSGRNTSSPFTTVSTFHVSSGSSPMSVDINGLTAAASDDLVIIGGLDNQSNGTTNYSYTAPSGYANAQMGTVNVAFATASFGADKVNASAGATGTVSGSLTFTGTGGDTGGWLIALAVAAAGTTAPAQWPRSSPSHPGRSPGQGGQRFYQSLKSYAVSSVGVLSGSADLVFGQTGTVSGTGALNATAALLVGQAGALTGSGALAGTSALTFSQTGAITGAGALSGSSALVFAQTGAVTAVGALAGSAALVFGQTGTLTQPGLVGSAALVFGQTGVLSASGVLAGSSALAFGQTALLAAQGALSGTSALVFGQSATLTAAGILAGSSALIFAQTATLTATGVLAGTSALTFGASATADVPAGTLQGTAALSFGASGTLTAFGALIGACQILFDASGTLTQPDSGKAGPVDSPRSAEGFYRRKRKTLRRAIEPEQPVFIAPASFEHAPPQAVIDRVPDFTTLAQRLGESPAALSVRIDREIEFLMREAQERDDEEALVLILTALE